MREAVKIKNKAQIYGNLTKAHVEKFYDKDIMQHSRVNGSLFFLITVVKPVYKVCPLYTVALYIQVKIICTIH